MSTPPGWYYAEGDPIGTQRYWDGGQWQGGPQPTMGYGSTGFATAGGGHDPDRSPVEWYRLALSRWNKFDGRARRAEYWWFSLGNGVIAVAFAIIAGLLANVVEAVGLIVIVGVALFALAMIVPTIAVTIRRLHDTNKSGWVYLLAVIPIINYIGGIVVFVFMCMDGTKGPNQYGPSPKH